MRGVHASGATGLQLLLCDYGSRAPPVAGANSRHEEPALMAHPTPARHCLPLNLRLAASLTPSQARNSPASHAGTAVDAVGPTNPRMPPLTHMLQ